MAARGEPLTSAAASAPTPTNENGMPALLSAISQINLVPPPPWPPARTYAAPGKVIVITKVNAWPVRKANQLTNITWAVVGDELGRREAVLDQPVQALAY